MMIGQHESQVYVVVVPEIFRMVVLMLGIVTMITGLVFITTPPTSYSGKTMGRLFEQSLT